jgi:dTMP kinase
MRWIVVEGIDGSGKNTMAHWIVEHYQSRGEKVLIRPHPSERWTGRVTRRFLEGRGRMRRTGASVFYILDVLGSLRRLKRDRRHYGTIVFVRYLLGTAYLPEQLVGPSHALFSHLLPVPRRLLLVDIDSAVASDRIKARMEPREMFENPESLGKARRRMRMLAGEDWAVIDNGQGRDAARSALEALLERWDRV